MNTMETYRKINQWTSHSRDMVESFKRYYNNSFLDRQRQEAYNLFLGNYTFSQGQPMLWDLSTDYYLHHADPRSWSMKTRKSYVNWFTPKNLERREISDVTRPGGLTSGKPLEFFDDYWLEYYRPLALSTFQKIFSFKMNSTLRYIHIKSTQEGKYDLSPFRVRSGNENESSERGRPRKEVIIIDPKKEIPGDNSSKSTYDSQESTAPALPSWLESQLHGQSGLKQGIFKEGTNEAVYPSLNSMSKSPKNKPSKDKSLKDKSTITQWTLDQFVTSSLSPSVADSEAHEYQRYISHPLNLPLVISTATPPNPNLELVTYINSNSLDAVTAMHSTEDDIADYIEFLDVGDEPLTVTEADTPKKRYKAYRQWLKGKSLFNSTGLVREK